MGDGGVDEGDAGGRLRSGAEDEVFGGFADGIDAAEGEGLFVGFAAPEDGVDGLEERGHAIGTFGVGAIEPVDGAVFAGDEAIGADGEIGDALAGHIGF